MFLQVSSNPGSSNTDSLVLYVKFGVIDTDERVTENPEGLGEIKALETTQTELLASLSYLWVRMEEDTTNGGGQGKWCMGEVG